MTNLRSQFVTLEIEYPLKKNNCLPAKTFCRVGHGPFPMVNIIVRVSTGPLRMRNDSLPVGEACFPVSEDCQRLGEG
jgi:hypothetical protein